MMFRNILTMPFSAFILATLALSQIHCSSSSSTASNGGDEVPQFTTVSDLPQASAPVVEAASASLSAVRGTPLFATTGITLKDMTASDFDADSSLAMCEMANTLKSSLNEAVQGDVILCYVQSIFADLTSNPSLADLDIYDGEEHIFDLAFSEEMSQGDTPQDFRVKMKITKNSDDVITNFQMWSCEGGEQTEYLSQTIDGTDFEMTSTYTYDDEWGIGGQNLSVAGELNADGQFTSKTITSSYTSDWTDGGAGYGSKTVVQGVDSATISVWDSGTWTWSNGQDSEEGTYANSAFGVIELLNTDTIATLAVGDGGARGTSSGTCCGSESYEEDFSQAWNGDTTAPSALADSDYNDVVEAGTPPTPGSEPTIAFSGDAAWDCDDTGNAAVDLTVDGTAIEEACSDLQLGWDWVSCWDIVENQN